MSYLWEVYDKEKKLEIAYDSFSPYVEVAASEVTDTIRVNTLIRYSDVFADAALLMDEKEAVNVALHFLAQLDHVKGVYDATLQHELMDEALKSGKYGDEVKGLYGVCEAEVQYQVRKYMLRDQTNKQRHNLFPQVIRAVFSKHCLMYEQSSDVFILCIGTNKTQKTQAIIKLIELLFAEVTWEIHIIWEYGIGICQEEKTMQIGTFAIY